MNLQEQIINSALSWIVAIVLVLSGTVVAVATEPTSQVPPRYMVSAANPKATEAGLDILRRGGNAVDAAIAVQLVLNLVEPQSSGIGGGSFMLFYKASTQEVLSYDGRETAPAEVTSDLFLTPEGEPMKFFDAVLGGRSVGTPGTVAMLAQVHKEYGEIPWSELFEPAIKLARDGFTVGHRLASMLAGRHADRLKTFAETREYYFPNGSPLTAGDIRTNYAFVETLIEIAQHGPEAFYRGAIAEEIVEAIRRAPHRSGLLALSDLSEYQAIRRPPICHSYRIYRICGMGPPSSGALTVGQILGLLEYYDLKSLGASNPISWHLIAEASKLAFADRNRYMADSDFVEVPTEGLLDPTYLANRSGLIKLDSALNTPATHGLLPGSPAVSYAADFDVSRSGTSHISIVDSEGNAVSMTGSIEGPFGSHLMVRGFHLNNELTDFSFVAEKDGMQVANRVEPGKRPRSSMTPTLVFNLDGSLRLVVGSPGGSQIIGFVVKTLIAVLDWDMDIQTAIDLGNVVNRNGTTDLEEGTTAQMLQSQLDSLGHQTRVRSLTSGLHGIEIVNGVMRGGADPRREGIALGE